MARILFDAMPNWMKCQDEKIDIRTIRKVTKSLIHSIYPSLSRI
jgi:hypothetical protein